MARWLDAHPDVFVTKPKEVFFFSHDGNYKRGWSHYLELYGDADDAIARGEATTDYCFVKQFPKTPERIAQHIPDCRLILMVRHPLDRIASQWELARSTGATRLPLSRAVFEFPQFVEVSRYLRTVQAYLKWFSAEQIHIVLFEEFKSDPRDQAQSCLEHIGVDPSVLPVDVSRAPNESRQLRRQLKVIRRLRKLKIMSYYRTVLSNRIRNRLHELVTRNRDWSIAWDRSSSLYVKDFLEDETRCFLERYTSKQPEYWSFDLEGLI